MIVSSSSAVPHVHRKPAAQRRRPALADSETAGKCTYATDEGAASSMVSERIIASMHYPWHSLQKQCHPATLGSALVALYHVAVMMHRIQRSYRAMWILRPREFSSHDDPQLAHAPGKPKQTKRINATTTNTAEHPSTPRLRSSALQHSLQSVRTFVDRSHCPLNAFTRAHDPFIHKNMLPRSPSKSMPRAPCRRLTLYTGHSLDPSRDVSSGELSIIESKEWRQSAGRQVTGNGFPFATRHLQSLCAGLSVPHPQRRHQAATRSDGRPQWCLCRTKRCHMRALSAESPAPSYRPTSSRTPRVA